MVNRREFAQGTGQPEQAGFHSKLSQTLGTDDCNPLVVGRGRTGAVAALLWGAWWLWLRLGPGPAVNCDDLRDAMLGVTGGAL